MTSTSNRFSVGDSVWCHDRNCEGTVVQETSLGLPFAPKVQVVDGTTVLYCGDKLQDCCQYVCKFSSLMSDLGYSSGEINAFRDSWFKATDRDTHRRVYYEGLCKALEEGTQDAYITNLSKTLGACL